MAIVFGASIAGVIVGPPAAADTSSVWQLKEIRVIDVTFPNVLIHMCVQYSVGYACASWNEVGFEGHECPLPGQPAFKAHKNLEYATGTVQVLVTGILGTAECWAEQTYLGVSAGHVEAHFEDPVYGTTVVVACDYNLVAENAATIAAYKEYGPGGVPPNRFGVFPSGGHAVPAPCGFSPSGGVFDIDGTPYERLQQLVPNDPYEVWLAKQMLLNSTAPTRNAVYNATGVALDSWDFFDEDSEADGRLLSGTSNLACTALLVHGIHWEWDSTPGLPNGVNTSNFAGIKNYMDDLGYSDVRRLDLYGGTCDDDHDPPTVDASIVGHGSHDWWHEGSQWQSAYEAHVSESDSCDDVEPLVHTLGTDIFHMANHLAWYIYDEFSSDGVWVDIVAHSLGGLFVRAMLADWRANIGSDQWPPTLLIEDIITVATPHSGAEYACAAMYAGSGYHQVNSMCANSGEMKWLKANGQNPQGNDTTQWSFMGSFRDALVAEASSRGMVGGGLYVLYGYKGNWDESKAKPHYGHNTYLSDEELDSEDAEIEWGYWEEGGARKQFVWDEGVHARPWIGQAVTSAVY